MQIFVNNRNKYSNLTKLQEHSLHFFRYVINLAMVQKLINKKKKMTTSMSIATPPWISEFRCDQQ